jgi:hypothetical protein
MRVLGPHADLGRRIGCLTAAVAAARPVVAGRLGGGIGSALPRAGALRGAAAAAHPLPAPRRIDRSSAHRPDPVSDPLTVRAMTAAEEWQLQQLAGSRTAEARVRDRARICWLASQGKSVATIKVDVGMVDGSVRLWITRFNVGGLDGLRDRRP